MFLFVVHLAGTLLDIDNQPLLLLEVRSKLQFLVVLLVHVSYVVAQARRTSLKYKCIK